MGWTIERTRPADPDTAEIIRRHVALMRAQSPAESCHVLDAPDLDRPETLMLALRDAGRALAIGALRLDADGTGELKSMHTVSEARGRGAGRALLRALVDLARKEGVVRLNLETGSGPEHEAARGLYRSEGFSPCPPFGTYVEDPLSLFMTRAL